MSSKELYRLTENSTIWTFTSTNEAEVYNLETYAPKIVGRSEISDKAQVSKATVDVTFPIDDPIGVHLMRSDIEAIVKLDIYSKDEAGEFENLWRGRLQKAAPSGDQIKVTFQSIFSSNRRVGARPVYQRACRHVLYGPGCKIAIATRQIAATITAMSDDGINLVIPAAAGYESGFFNAGVVVAPDGTMRYIVSQVGSAVQLIRSSDVLSNDFAASGSVSVMIAPGCTQQIGVCGGRFGNLPNNGGFPYIPEKNPMGGSSIV